MLDFLGYTTAPEDFEAAQEQLPQVIDWLFSTPWWVPSLTMALLTGLVIWVCLPRERATAVSAAPSEQETEPSATEPKYVSRFAGKTPAVPETIPQRLIDAIDRDDARIQDRIRLHYVEKPITIQMHLDAADPYVDIDVMLYNNSVFPVSYSDIDGRFHFKGQPLSSAPQVLDNVTLNNDRAGHIKIRQYVLPHIAEQMIEWNEGDLTFGNIRVDFRFLDRHDREKHVFYKRWDHIRRE